MPFAVNTARYWESETARAVTHHVPVASNNSSITRADSFPEQSPCQDRKLPKSRRSTVVQRGDNANLAAYIVTHVRTRRPIIRHRSIGRICLAAACPQCAILTQRMCAGSHTRCAIVSARMRQLNQSPAGRPTRRRAISCATSPLSPPSDFRTTVQWP
jgi:hypothetical protein